MHQGWNPPYDLQLDIDIVHVIHQLQHKLAKACTRQWRLLEEQLVLWDLYDASLDMDG